MTLQKRTDKHVYGEGVVITSPPGTVKVYDDDTDTLLASKAKNNGEIYPRVALPRLARGYYNFRLVFEPDAIYNQDYPDGVETHNSSSYVMEDVYVKGYDTSITFTPEYDSRGNEYAITIQLTDTQGVLSGETLTLTYPDSSTETFTTDSNGEVYVPLLYVPLSFDDVEVAFAGDTYQEPCTGVYEAWVAHPPYIVGEGVSFMDSAPVIDFRSSDWNKSSNVSLVDGTTLKLGTSGTNKVVVYTEKKLLRGDSISVRVNATNLYHDTYRIGLSSVNSTTSSTVDGGHLASLYRGSSYNRIEEGSGFSVVEACTMRLGSTWKPITFTTDANNRIVVIVDGESHATNTVLPTGGAYIYINKTSTSYNMFVDGLVYSYQKRGVTDWNERVDYSGITPHNVSDWRQYSGSSLAVNNTSTGNRLNVPSGHKIVYPVNLGGNFSLSVKLGNNGATTKSYWFGIYKGCPSNPVNNFNTGMLTGIQYYNGALYVLNSAIEINNWELENTLKQVDIIYDGNSITYKFYNSSESVVKTVSQAGQFGTDCYFALYNGCNANITISDFKVGVEHNINDTRTRNDFVSVEGDDNGIDSSTPVTAFNDNNYLTNQSTSLVGSNGTRLFLTPSTTSTTSENYLHSKYRVIHRGEAVEIGLCIYQNDSDNNTVNVHVGLSSNNGTIYTSLNVIAEYHQSHTAQKIIANNTSDQTTTNTLGVAYYRYVGFWADKDGKITVKVNGETKTTNAVLPESGAYLFVTNYRQKSPVGVNRIYYHSYSGL